MCFFFYSTIIALLVSSLCRYRLNNTGLTQHLTRRELLFCSQALHGRPHQTETFWGPFTSRVRPLLCHRVCNHAEVKEGQERYEAIC